MKPRIPLPENLARRGFSAAEGLQAGLGRQRMLGHDLARPFRGVYLPANLPQTLRRQCEGLAARLNNEAFFCGVTAARLMSIPLPTRWENSPVIQVGVPKPRYRPTGRGLQGHSFDVGPSDVREWNGLRITSPERTWCDLGIVLSVSDLVAAGDFLIHWQLPITSVQRLAAEAHRRRGHRGIKTVVAALPYLHDRSESPQESRLRYILVVAQLPGLVVNLPITTSDGYRYRADLAFPAQKVIIEYQSGLHNSPEAYRADMTRVSRLEADEWKVMLVNSNDMANPAELVRRVERVLEGRIS